MSQAAARALREDADEPTARADLRLIADEDALGPRPVYAENGRRTVRITGQPTPARPRRSGAAKQIQARPDRIALWAFLLGLFLVFMAVATASAAPLQ
jgi:thiol:disulfide interchange protein